MTSKLTLDTALKLVAARRRGLSVEDCAASANVGLSTLKNWRSSTDDPKSIAKTFALAFDSAYEAYLRERQLAFRRELRFPKRHKTAIAEAR